MSLAIADSPLSPVPGPALEVLQRAFGAGPDLLAVAAEGGRLLSSNRLPPVAEIPFGGSIFDLVAEADRDAVRRLHAAVWSTGAPRRIELACPRSDGSPGWFLFTLRPLHEDGAVTAIVYLGVDLTPQRQEMERLRRVESLMIDTQGIAHLGVWEWDITQPTASWSPGLYRIYGLDPARYVPSYEEYLKRVHPDDRQRVMDATNAAFHHHKAYSHDERILHADGSTRFLHTWAMPVLDAGGKLVRLMGVCQDITDRKLAEEEAERHAAELQRSNEELEQFAYVASHDLQEPLRAVASFVQLLERRYRGRLDAQADEMIGFAVQGVQRMKGLITDLLEYSRLRRVPSAAARYGFAEALARARSALADSIRESGAVIRQDVELPDVRIEPNQFVSLLQNLISNAIKFRRGDAPQVVLGGRVEGAQVHAWVQDNGVGIAPAHRDRIFGLFERLNRDMPGTGIGLAICRKLVERHGGRMWVESEPGRGSTFHFTLPAA